VAFQQLNKVLTIIIFISACNVAAAQSLTNARQKQLIFTGDSVFVDSLSIIPGSLFLISEGIVVDESTYRVDYAASLLIRGKGNINLDTVIVVYRVFPVFFGRAYAFRELNERKIAGKDEPGLYIYSQEDRSQELFKIEGLTKSGSISRGISIGNNQDAVVNSSLNLQLSGRLSNNIDVAAAITDDNIPVQPEGNTQQLQEFDKVFIQLSNEKNKLIAGDFVLLKPEGYFMSYYKRGQGGWYSNKSTMEYVKGRSAEIQSTVSGAVSRGKFSRNTFNGIESNQGPYRLTGAENEAFIVILSGSEKIFIDGKLLKRGQSYDYVIDYNTAEITFTPQFLITKDVRIVAEFQYSDKNYARTLFYGGTIATSGNNRSWINIYSEQDVKNQPLQQDLSEDQKRLLAASGDNLAAVLTPSVDSVAFNVNEILYLKKDTLVATVLYKDVFVWSVNPDSAFYRLGFSQVGANKGNYILSTTSANGRVYQWVAPVNGVPQGTFEPVILLTTPKKRQMVNAGYGWKEKGKSEFSVEFAGSKDDVNTFSKKDKANDGGWAAVTNVSRTIPLSKKTKIPWDLITSGRYEYTYKYFKQVENFRAVEFTRDWNTGSVTDTSDEHNASAGLTLQQGPLQSISYTFRSYTRPGSYQGLMHVFRSSDIYKSFLLKTEASYLNTSGKAIRSEFIRHKEDFSRQWKYFRAGIKYEEERNKIKSGISDTLSLVSFAFRDAGLYIETSDSSRFRTAVSYSKRTDELPRSNALTSATVSDNVAASAGYMINRSNRISVSVKYRKLTIKDSTITILKEDESLLSKVEHQLSAAKGLITATTYYETGSGREQRKEFSYIAVAPGTGNFSWNDYNGDGIPQLNEFEIPQFQDQATYIRVFTPSNQFIKVFTNQLNMVINIQPGALQRNNIWSKLGLLTAFRFDNKITGSKTEDGINPFLSVYDEASLISNNASGRTTLFINKTGQITGTDISYNSLQNRQLLSYGIETREEQEWQTNTRINFSQTLSSFTDLSYQEKKNNSEAFSARNYNLNIYKASEKFSYQPGSVWRISLLYTITGKENVIGDAGEKSLLQKGGMEFRYSSVRKGLFTASFNLVNIDFNQPENTPLAYEMLEGLKQGVNYTWNASLQRNISSAFQLSLNYEGRKPDGIKVIHTGGIQARAFF
jgi:hypothetical protein